VHALVGENGAGKSTLMNILGGVYPYGSYDGEILVDDQLCLFDDVRHAEEAGIAVVHQELSLVPEFSIAENIFLGREPCRFGVIETSSMYSRAQRVLDELQLKLGPHLPVGYLGIGQQHLVEIAKALARDARILVLDEPTAALTDTEADVLFGILNRLRANGAGIVYISHKLEEVRRLSDRITVLRDGRAVRTEPTSTLATQNRSARRVGVAQPYVFSLFGSKKELFSAAVERGFRLVAETFTRAAADFDPAMVREGGDVLHVMGSSYVELLRSNRDYLMLQLHSYAACDDEVIRDRVRACYAQLVAHVRDLSGADPDRLDDFIRHGMSLNVAAAMGVQAAHPGR